MHKILFGRIITFQFSFHVNSSFPGVHLFIAHLCKTPFFHSFGSWMRVTKVTGHQDNQADSCAQGWCIQERWQSSFPWRMSSVAREIRQTENNPTAQPRIRAKEVPSFWEMLRVSLRRSSKWLWVLERTNGLISNSYFPGRGDTEAWHLPALTMWAKGQKAGNTWDGSENVGGEGSWGHIVGSLKWQGKEFGFYSLGRCDRRKGVFWNRYFWHQCFRVGSSLSRSPLTMVVGREPVT